MPSKVFYYHLVMVVKSSNEQHGRAQVSIQRFEPIFARTPVV
jgi:hypothetical protein